MSNVELSLGNGRREPDFRDLAIKIIEANSGAKLDYLAEEFIDQVRKHPAYMRSIALYCMSNVLQAVEAKHPRTSAKRARNTLIEPTVTEVEEQVIQKQAKKLTTQIVSNLLGLRMPNGKDLGDCNGKECRQLGRFGLAIAEKIGPRGIVREKMSEAELQILFTESKKR